MDCSPSGSSVRRVFQARILEWVAVAFSRGSSQPRDQSQVSCIAGGFFTRWDTGKPKILTLPEQGLEPWTLRLSLMLSRLSRAHKPWNSQVAQWWRTRLPMQEMQETWARSLGPEHPLVRKWQPSSVQPPSRARLFATPRTAARQSSLSITNSRSLLDPLQCSSWEILWTEEPGGLQSMGSRRVGQSWATEPAPTYVHSLLLFLPIRASWWLSWKSVCPQCGKPGFDPWVTKIPWRRKWRPTPVLLPGQSHGWRSLAGYSPWGGEESDTTERLHFHFSLSCIGEGNGNPLQCSCLENPRVGGAWWARLWGRTESDTTEAT